MTDQRSPHISLASKVLQDRTAEEVIETAAHLGLGGIEWFCLPQHLSSDTPIPQVTDLARRSRDSGLETVCLSTYVGGFAEGSDAECAHQLDVFARYVEMAVRFACPLLRVWPDMMGRSVRPPVPRETVTRAAHYIQKAADQAAGGGLQIGIELHLTIGAYVDLVLPLLAQIDRPNVGLIYDPGNLHLARVPYGPPVIKQLGSRIVHVQIKDGSATSPTPTHLRDEPTLQMGGDFDLLLGEGEIDFPPLLDALHAVGYRGWYSVECHAQPRPGRPSTAIALTEYTTLSQLLQHVPLFRESDLR